MARNGTEGEVGSGFWRWTKRLLLSGLFVGLLGLVVLGIFVASARGQIKSFEKLKASPNGQMIRLRASDGTVIQSLGPSFGRWLPISKVPQTMKNAMVAVEDKRYYYHPGVDPIGITRSAWIRLTSGHWSQGGSTITQQLARNIYLNSNKEFGRKAREIILAMALETKFSKEQILELYLNKVYFGGGAFGVDAASRKFFDHGAEELKLPEAAIIAGLVKAPSHYSPTADAEAAVGRAGVVLDLMHEDGMISAEQAAKAKKVKVQLASEKPQDSVRYFTDWALPQLEGLVKDTDKPIDVWTTIDLGMQRAGTAAIIANAPRGAQGALVAIDRDGAVRAMVGGTDYVKSNYNRAVTALRQPGSSWKLFVYMAALEAGFRPEDRVVDKPVTIAGWSPKNSGGGFSGEMSLRTAFAFSKNTVAAQIGEAVGTGAVANMARRFGITTRVSTGPSMVLGSSEAKVIEMTRAFAEVQAKGRSLSPYGISKVTDIDGAVLYTHKAGTAKQLVQPYVAAGITDLMQSAVAGGTGKGAQIGRPVAGKTGTTTSNKDGWFLGFSSGLTTGVWFGRDDAKPVPNLQGGHNPASAWAAFMRYAVAKRPVEHFASAVAYPEPPDGQKPKLSGSDETDEGTIDEEAGPPTDGEAEDLADGEQAAPSQVEGREKSATKNAGPAKEPDPLDEEWIDRALGRNRQAHEEPKPQIDEELQKY